jgi:Protein of unknown function (DUF2934)
LALVAFDMTEKKRTKVGPAHQANPTDQNNAQPLPKRSRKRARTSGESAPLPTSGAPPSRVDGSDARGFADAREEMIRIAAYYLAQERGFAPGAEMDDWLAAEIAIDANLNE